MSASVVPERLRRCLWVHPRSANMAPYPSHSQNSSRVLPKQAPFNSFRATPEECLNVGQRSARASSEVFVGTPKVRQHGPLPEPQPKFESNPAQAGASQ